jgi:hypothetical protein
MQSLHYSLAERSSLPNGKLPRAASCSRFCLWPAPVNQHNEGQRGIANSCSIVLDNDDTASPAAEHGRQQGNSDNIAGFYHSLHVNSVLVQGQMATPLCTIHCCPSMFHTKDTHMDYCINEARASLRSFHR